MQYYKCIVINIIIITSCLMAAEFDIDEPTIYLQQLQYCEKCQLALIVNNIRPGTEIKCAECGEVQKRLPDKYLLHKLYYNKNNEKVYLTQQDIKKMVEKSGLYNKIALVVLNSTGLGYGDNNQKLIVSNEIEGNHLQNDQKILKEKKIAEAKINMPEIVAEGARQQEKIKNIYGENPVFQEKPNIAPPTWFEKEKRSKDSNVITVPAITAESFRKKENKTDFRKSNKILAKVNYEKISSQEVADIIMPLMAEASEKILNQVDDKQAKVLLEELDNNLKTQVLKSLIERRLLLQEANNLKVNVDKEQLASIYKMLKNKNPNKSEVDIEKLAVEEAKIVALRELITDKVQGVSPEDVRKYYKEKQKDLIKEKAYAIEELIIYVDRKIYKDKRPADIIAEEIAKKLEEGVKFDLLREEYNEFSAGKRLNFQSHEKNLPMPLGYYASPLKEFLAIGKVKAIYGPIQQDNSIIFFKIIEILDGDTLAFNEVEKSLQKELQNIQKNKVFEEFIQQLRKKANINIYQ